MTIEDKIAGVCFALGLIGSTVLMIRFDIWLAVMVWSILCLWIGISHFKDRD